MILLLRRNLAEYVQLHDTGGLLPPANEDFHGMARKMNAYKTAMHEVRDIENSFMWFELTIERADGFLDVYEVPAEIDTADGLNDWYMTEVQ